MAASVPTFAGTTAFVQGPDWKSYVWCLDYIQKQQPGAYLPIELIRIDRLPEAEFVPQATKYARLWRDLNRHGSRRGLERELTQVSRDANETLTQLLKKTALSTKRPLRGSIRLVLDSTPESMRIALSPLDKVFSATDIGKKVNKDLADRNNFLVQSVSFNDKTKNLEFEGGPFGNLEMTARLPPFYTLSTTDFSSTGLTRFRGLLFGSQDPVGSDVQLRRQDLRGSFFNSNDKAPLPFGAYPQAQERFVDDSGATHFSGDGHNHAH